jgi:gamma-glutamyltranspeptidase/glutathione hydrolase
MLWSPAQTARSWRGGEATRNLLLADVLVEWAREGDALFRTGRVARSLAEAMADEGLVTAEDLVSYAPVTRPATRLQVGEWEIACNPPPAVGGPMLAIMLGELGRRERWDWSDAIEIQRAVLGYRHRTHDLSHDLEADGLALLESVGVHGLSALRGSSSTAHISAVDADGNACAITMSSGYGSGLCIRAPGFCSTTHSARSNSIATGCTRCRQAPGWPPTWRRRQDVRPMVGRWRSAPLAPTGSPPH